MVKTDGVAQMVVIFIHKEMSYLEISLFDDFVAPLLY